ncbi:hypothetical protein KAU04_02095, partial [bacterium]|nr:hypothetical protein [bacterium]
MNKRLLSAAILAAILVIPLAFLVRTSPASGDSLRTEARERIPLPQNRDLLRAGKARLEPLLWDAKSYTPHSYDVLHYEINMDIDIPGDTVRTASVFIDCQSQMDTLTTVDLRFFRMVIDSITVDGDSTAYTRDSDQLLIHLDSAISQGDTFQVAVHYHGRPITGSAGVGLFINPGVTYTFCAPDGAYRWFPCYDHPCDKATADLN